MRDDNAVCPECREIPYSGSHHGQSVYKCKEPSCFYYGSPLARTKAELRRVVTHIDTIDMDKCPVCNEAYNHRVDNGYRNRWPSTVSFEVCTPDDSDTMYVHTQRLR